MSTPVIGVLALQGAFALHQAAMELLGAECRLVKTADELEGLDGLILPGGESTVMGKLLENNSLKKAISVKAGSGFPIFGTCAGLILLADEIEGQETSYLGLLNLRVRRNGWGRQKDSFRTRLNLEGESIDGIFIRAPRILETGAGVDVIISLNGEAVLVRQRSILAATFHPELTSDLNLHRYFIEKICCKSFNK